MDARKTAGSIHVPFTWIVACWHSEMSERAGQTRIHWLSDICCCSAIRHCEHKVSGGMFFHPSSGVSVHNWR